MLLTLLPVPGRARTRRPDQPKTLGRTFVKCMKQKKKNIVSPKFREHPRCRVRGVLVPYERKKERKERLAGGFYHVIRYVRDEHHVGALYIAPTEEK